MDASPQASSDAESAQIAPDPSDHQTLYTVEQLSAEEPAFTEPAIRNLIFKAEPRQSTRGVIPGNGLLEAGAVIRIGRKVLLHKQRFLGWADAQGRLK